jgi:hypothetical protein
MRPTYRSVLLFLALLTPLGLFTSNVLQAGPESSFTSAQSVVAPLQTVSVGVSMPGYNGPATLVVFDSAGRAAGAWELTMTGGSGSVQVTPRGALGDHWAALFASGQQVANGTIYRLDAETTVQTGSKQFDQLYPRVRSFMNQVRLGYELDGTYVQGYRSPDSPLLWLRDHYYQGRAYRYFDTEATNLIDAFRRAQQPDGSLPDFLARPVWDIPAFRTPVEADVEYLFVQAIYETWQMTGNDEWMLANLLAAQRAISYTLTSPLRWEPTLGLVKRPFTIDTWDFEYGPTTIDPTNGKPAPRHWIDDQTKWGVFHGDNTGLAQALRSLAHMEQQAGLWESAWYRRDQAAKIIAPRNTLSWNGSFYTHHVKLVPYDVPGVDEASQLSLSNALALNRDVLTVEQGRAILAEYLRRRENKDNIAFAEWWSIDPPFPPGRFGLDGRLGERPGEYVNGGIMPLVGGELARGAFRYGYEEYGFDILRRYYEMVERTNASYLWYHPTGGVSVSPHTLPTDGWGASAMLGALMEGAAGIEDKSIRYSDATLSPRWSAATNPAGQPVDNAFVVARYAASDGYAAYRWQYDRASNPHMLRLEATGSGANLNLRLLLPGTVRNVATVTLNGQPIAPQIESIGDSRYLVLSANGPIVQVQVILER